VSVCVCVCVCARIGGGYAAMCLWCGALVFGRKHKQCLC